MLVVSVPHTYLLNLNQKYYVYDTDDGVVESVYADAILSMLSVSKDSFLNMELGHFGGMLSNGRRLPDGKYKVYSEFEDDLCMVIRGGIIVEPIGCQDADFVGSVRGIEYKFVKGKAIRL